MAGILEDAGDYAQAANMIQETINDMRKQGDARGEILALGSLGIIQAKAEDYENALMNLGESARLGSEAGIPPSQLRDLDFYLAEIYEGFKDYESALIIIIRRCPLLKTLPVN